MKEQTDKGFPLLNQKRKESYTTTEKERRKKRITNVRLSELSFWNPGKRKQRKLAAQALSEEW